MSNARNRGKKLITDKNTDYLFDYYMNEEKFNEQMRKEWDENMEKKLQNHNQINMDSRIPTEKKTSKATDSTEEEVELPSETNGASNSSKSEVEFDESSDSDDTETSSQSSVKTPYKQKIEAKPRSEMRPKAKTETKPKTEIKRSESKPRALSEHNKKIQPQKLIQDIPKYVETKEEKRARARTAYSTLQDMITNHKIVPTHRYTIDDDPDEIEAEIAMHRERRNKHNQVKLYKNVLLNIVCGIEFMNDKYDPFDIKLRDWSKQVASDMDDYTEVLEEIYEKYKDSGGKMSPEIKLLFMIIMSGVTFHLSQTLFGSGGLNDTIKGNPNILNSLLKTFMKGGPNQNDHQEPEEARQPPPDSKNILSIIKKHNQARNGTTTSTPGPTTNTNATTTEDTESVQPFIANKELDRERRKLMDQQAQLDAQMKRQNEMFQAQMEQLRNQQNNMIMNQRQQTQQIQPQIRPQPYIPPTPQQNQPMNTILSDASKRPRFQSTMPNVQPVHQLINQQTNQPNQLNQMSMIKSKDDDMDIFESESSQPASVSRNSVKSSGKNKKTQFDELIESLEESTSVDLDNIIETSSKKKKSQNSVSKPIVSVKNKNNSATRTTGKKSKTDSISETVSASKNNNIIKL